MDMPGFYGFQRKIQVGEPKKDAFLLLENNEKIARIPICDS
jgi:hypothetical protein